MDRKRHLTSLASVHEGGTDQGVGEQVSRHALSFRGIA
jgi:hypothetical protein